MTWDEARLQEIREEDRRQEAAKRRSRRIWFVVAVVVGVPLAGWMAWSMVEHSKRGHPLTIIGQEDEAVRVEVDGESFEIPPRGRTYFTPARPGTMKFVFDDFEAEYDVPSPSADDSVTLAVPTEEGMCFYMLDVTKWYESTTFLDYVNDKGTSSGMSQLPPPDFVTRIKPLDPLPSRHFSRNWNLPNLVTGDEKKVLTLVDVPCTELHQDERSLIGRFEALEPSSSR